MRARLRTALLVGALLAAPSCQWAGDTKAARVSFAALKESVEDVNARLTSAVEEGSGDRVLGLDREHLSISVATARRCLTAMDRYAQSGDAELLRAQNQQLQPTIVEIQELLDRADRTTTAE